MIDLLGDVGRDNRRTVHNLTCLQAFQDGSFTTSTPIALQAKRLPHAVHGPQKGRESASAKAGSGLLSESVSPVGDLRFLDDDDGSEEFEEVEGSSGSTGKRLYARRGGQREIFPAERGVPSRRLAGVNHLVQAEPNIVELDGVPQRSPTSSSKSSESRPIRMPVSHRHTSQPRSTTKPPSTTTGTPPLTSSERSIPPPTPPRRRGSSLGLSTAAAVLGSSHGTRTLTVRTQAHEISPRTYGSESDRSIGRAQAGRSLSRSYQGYSIARARAQIQGQTRSRKKYTREVYTDYLVALPDPTESQPGIKLVTPPTKRIDPHENKLRNSRAFDMITPRITPLRDDASEATPCPDARSIRERAHEQHDTRRGQGGHGTSIRGDTHKIEVGATREVSFISLPPQPLLNLERLSVTLTKVDGEKQYSSYCRKTSRTPQDSKNSQPVNLRDLHDASASDLGVAEAETSCAVNPSNAYGPQISLRATKKHKKVWYPQFRKRFRTHSPIVRQSGSRGQIDSPGPHKSTPSLQARIDVLENLMIASDGTDELLLRSGGLASDLDEPFDLGVMQMSESDLTRPKVCGAAQRDDVKWPRSEDELSLTYRKSGSEFGQGRSAGRTTFRSAYTRVPRDELAIPDDDDLYDYDPDEPLPVGRASTMPPLDDILSDDMDVRNTDGLANDDLDLDIGEHDWQVVTGAGRVRDQVDQVMRDLSLESLSAGLQGPTSRKSLFDDKRARSHRSTENDLGRYLPSRSRAAAELRKSKIAQTPEEDPADSRSTTKQNLNANRSTDDAGLDMNSQRPRQTYKKRRIAPHELAAGDHLRKRPRQNTQAGRGGRQRGHSHQGTAAPKSEESEMGNETNDEDEDTDDDQRIVSPSEIALRAARAKRIAFFRDLDANYKLDEVYVV